MPTRGTSAKAVSDNLHSFIGIPPPLLNDIANMAVIDALGSFAGDAVDLVQAPEEDRLPVGGRVEAFEGRDELLLVDGADDIGRDDDDELRLVGLEIAAAEEGAEDRQVLQAGGAVDVLLDGVLDKTGHDHGAAARQFNRGFGAANLQAWHGEVGARNGQRILWGELAHLGVDAHADLSFRHDHWREAKADAKGLELDLDFIVVGADRHGIFAARQELGGFAGDGGEGRLSQGPQQAIALQGSDLEVDKIVAAGEAQKMAGGGQRAIDREGVFGIEGARELADREASGDVHTQLLQNVALHFGDPHFEHDLLAAGDGDRAQHFFGITDELDGEVHGPLRLARIGRDAAQDDIVIDRIDGDGRSRNSPLDQILEGERITRDLEIEAQNLAAFAIEEEHIGLAKRAAKEVGAVLGADDSIDDRRVAHDDVLGRRRQLDDHGLAYAEAHEFRAACVRFGGVCRRYGISRRQGKEGDAEKDGE